MLSPLWVFVGAVSGLLIVSVFVPPVRKEMYLPLPNDKGIFRTPSGCVQFKTEEIPCSSDATSLNFIASLNK